MCLVVAVAVEQHQVGEAVVRPVAVLVVFLKRKQGHLLIGNKAILDTLPEL